uniref:Dehydrin Rab15 n=1 Tax=Ananas comosus var. bracteatus TaxID=296719 RepID=A0A6V7PVY9_ANACO|nr:unnamed protein product [Ananas comosus var. bracteatus]
MTGVGPYGTAHPQGGVPAPWPKPCPPVDAYGNPIRESYNATGAATGAHGKTGVGPYGTAHPQGGVPAAGGGHGQLKPERERRHRRSGSSSSSSSSSSEDDGMGGRRKKGVKQKIKEKMPGGRKTDDEHRYVGQTAPATTATAPATTATAPMTTATAPMTTATAPPTAAEGGRGRKGMMEKIKEKLPGGGH